MRAGRSGLGLVIPVLALASCVSGTVAERARKPVRWIFVEKRADEVYSGAAMGQGPVDPAAPVLTVQPLYSEDVNWEVVVDPRAYFVELVSVDPRPQAAPGEVVTATVRVGGARPEEMYRLIARPSQSDVRILGDREKVVRGSRLASFQFTSLSTGRGGIGVEVERIDREEGRIP